MVYIIARNGKGAVMAYTIERYEKFKKNILASGYRVAKIEEIQKYYDLEDVTKIEDKKEIIALNDEHEISK